MHQKQTAWPRRTNLCAYACWQNIYFQLHCQRPWHSYSRECHSRKDFENAVRIGVFWYWMGHIVSHITVKFLILFIWLRYFVGLTVLSLEFIDYTLRASEKYTMLIIIARIRLFGLPRIILFIHQIKKISPALKFPGQIQRPMCLLTIGLLRMSNIAVVWLMLLAVDLSR